MRVPLKAQIVLPLAAVTLATIAALAAYQARTAARQAEQRIARQIAGVTQALAGSTFPLTPRVLAQMRDLSGAEFVVETPDEIGAATLEATAAERDALAKLATPADAAETAFATTVQLDGDRYFHADVTRREFGRRDRVHVLYPEDDYRRALAAAAWPPVILGAAAMAAVIAAGWWTASRVTGGVSAIRAQVDRIAGGDFRPGDPPARDDELGDLTRGVNQMAEHLAQYDREVRRTEQLRTLGQLGAGLAHEIRNSATGARLALQHHEQACPGDADQRESLEIAARQLEHIEEYVQRLVRVGRDQPEGEKTNCDLAAVVREAAALAAPYARHLGVSVQLAAPAETDHPATAIANAAAVRQALYNLLVNAIDAAHGSSAPEVSIGINTQSDGAVVTIADNGPGPAAELVERMFEPFATNKPDGAGLGLALVQRVADDHNGSVAWRRAGDHTQFTLKLPREPCPDC